jgi:hypothetical protein
MGLAIHMAGLGCTCDLRRSASSRFEVRFSCVRRNRFRRRWTRARECLHSRLLDNRRADFVTMARQATAISDSQHRFHVDGWNYIIEVCYRCGPASEPVLVFDTIIYACVSDALLDHECNEPEKVVRHVFDQVHPLLPDAVDLDQWWEFEHRVHEWVCEHRAAGALRMHEI